MFLAVEIEDGKLKLDKVDGFSFFVAVSCQPLVVLFLEELVLQQM